MASFEQKLGISAGSAVLFAILSLPETYKFTNTILSTYDVSTGCPTLTGQLVHTLVFFLITFLTMGDVGRRTMTKLKHTIYGTLIYAFISSPMMYAFTGSFLGTATQGGCPNMYGILLHSIVYMMVLVGVMYLP